MKANEVMIGDWVMQDDNLQQNRVCQITGIYNNVVVDVTGEKLPLHESHIKPIPLTPEILEKNGFEKVYDKYQLPNYRIKWNSYTELYFTIFTGVDGYWNPVGFGVTIGGVQGNVDYVHQLQHALRLCGIKKEIKL